MRISFGLALVLLSLLIPATSSARDVPRLELQAGSWQVVDPYRYDEARRFERGWNRGADAIAVGGVARAVTGGTVRFAGTIAGRRVITVMTKLADMDVVVTYTGLTSLGLHRGDEVRPGDRLGTATIVHVGAYDGARRSRYLPVVSAQLAPPGGSEGGLGGAVARRLQQAIDGTALPGGVDAAAVASGGVGGVRTAEASTSGARGGMGDGSTAPATSPMRGVTSAAAVHRALLGSAEGEDLDVPSNRRASSLPTIRRAGTVQRPAVFAAGSETGGGHGGASAGPVTTSAHVVLPRMPADRPRHASMVARRALAVIARSIDVAPDRSGPAPPGGIASVNASSRPGHDGATAGSVLPVPATGGAVVQLPGGEPDAGSVAGPHFEGQAREAASALEDAGVRRARSDVAADEDGVDIRGIGLVLFPLAVLLVMTALARRRTRGRRLDEGAPVHRIPAPVVPSPRRHGRVVPRMPAEEWCEPHVPIAGEVGLGDIDQPHEHPVRRRPREPA